MCDQRVFFAIPLYRQRKRHRIRQRLLRCPLLRLFDGTVHVPDWSAKEEPVPCAKLDDPQTLNLYSYIQNNPLIGVDPDGHCDWCQKLKNFLDHGAGHFVTDAELPKVLEADSQESLKAPHISPAELQRIEALNTAVTMAMVANVGGEEAGLDEEIVASESALAKAATGGIGPVLKGAAGVEKAVAQIESEGGTVVAREVTVENSAGRARVDVVYKDASGNLQFGEAKNGPTAVLNSNQRAVYGAMQNEGAQLVGGNASKAGLPSSVGPGTVRVFKY